MANFGRSKGCNTCKERRVKCDEGTPSCKNCIRLGRVCGGYKKKERPVRFKVNKTPGSLQKLPKETQPPTPESTASEAIGQLVIIPCLTQPEQDVALPFFLRYFATLGRDLASTRGLFESIIPAFYTERQDSTFSITLGAVSLRFLQLWRYGPGSFRNPCQPLLNALQSLRDAIQNPVDRDSQATVLAAMLLQFHENLCAVYERRPSTRLHQNGALALMLNQLPSATSTVFGRQLLCHMLHTEVSSAVREKRGLPTDVTFFLKYNSVLRINPSAELDRIGIQVANLQRDFTEFSTHSYFDTASPETLAKLWAEMQDMRTQIRRWSRTLPDTWKPVKRKNTEKASSKVISYQETYEIYLSMQIAAIWNVSRGYELIVLKMMLVFLSLNPGHVEVTNDSGTPTYTIDLIFNIQDVIQDIVDSICHSVPFFIGNRTAPSILSDLTDPHVVLPGFYSLNMTDETLPDYVRNAKYVSREDHTQHVIARGPWHLMSALSHLLDRAAEPYGAFLVQSLREGQFEWIRSQVVRIAIIMKITSPSEQQAEDKKHASSQLQVEPAGVDLLVAAVRAGMRLSGGS
jgi:hypothetical protein